MPQMAPTLWLFMLLTTGLLLMLIYSYIYFFMDLNKEIHAGTNKNLPKLNWLW